MWQLQQGGQRYQRETKHWATIISWKKTTVTSDNDVQSSQPSYCYTSAGLHQTQSESNQKSATTPIHQIKLHFRLLQI